MARRKKHGDRSRVSRITGGRRWTESYPVARTIWDVYHTEDSRLMPSGEGAINPSTMIWIGSMLQHVLRTQAQRIELRFIARVYRDDGQGGEEAVGIRWHSIPLTRAQAESLRPSTEQTRALSGGRKLDAHEEALSVFNALVSRAKAGGLADRRARGVARREMQHALGYANPRSLTNLLQPGARRGVSPDAKARLDALYADLGAPPFPPPKSGRSRDVPWSDTTVQIEDSLRAWVQDLKRRTGPKTDRISRVEFIAVEVRGVRHA